MPQQRNYTWSKDSRQPQAFWPILARSLSVAEEFDAPRKMSDDKYTVSLTAYVVVTLIPIPRDRKSNPMVTNNDMAFNKSEA